MVIRQLSFVSLSLPLSPSSLMTSPKIALFGTSADPPTAGHESIIQWLSQHYDHVVVWASDNPFKTHQTPLQHRTAMLLILAEAINERQNISIHPELSSPRTLETVAKAKQMWGNAEFTLVIGSDLVTQLPRWYQVETLLQQVELLVVPRPGYAVEESGLETLRQKGAKIVIATLDAPAVSSTAYREQGDRDAIAPPIQDYIHREQLYAWQDAVQRR